MYFSVGALIETEDHINPFYVDLPWPKIFMNVEFNYEVIDIDPLFPRVWTVLNFKVLTFTV